MPVRLPDDTSEHVGVCRLRPNRKRWLVVDVSNGRAHVCLSYAAAVALAQMISRPLDPRTLPVGWGD